MSRLGDLYDRDFMLWTQEQSAALRRAKGANLPLDWDNLAEEIESLGISQRHGLRSQVTRILRHLLKLQVSAATEPRAGWRTTIREARTEIEPLLEDSPSLVREVDGLIRKQSRAAARLAADDLERHGELGDETLDRLRQASFTAEQVLAEDWFPAAPGRPAGGGAGK